MGCGGSADEPEKPAPPEEPPSGVIVSATWSSAGAASCATLHKAHYLQTAVRGRATRGAAVYALGCAEVDGFRKLVSGGDDCMVRVWDTDTRIVELSRIEGHNKAVRCVAACASHLISGADDGATQRCRCLLTLLSAAAAV